MSFKEYLSEAKYKILGHKKNKVGSTYHHEVEVQSKSKIDFDEIATEVGYHPAGHGIRKSKAKDLGNGKWLYTFDTATSAD